MPLAPSYRSSTPLALAAALLLGACSRELPSEWPDSSAVAIHAEPAPPATVTLALDSDPPLPGEPSEGWIGLERPDTGAAHEHHPHHGHASPGSSTTTSEAAGHAH